MRVNVVVVAAAAAAATAATATAIVAISAVHLQVPPRQKLGALHVDGFARHHNAAKLEDAVVGLESTKGHHKSHAGPCRRGGRRS